MLNIKSQICVCLDDWLPPLECSCSSTAPSTSKIETSPFPFYNKAFHTLLICTTPPPPPQEHKQVALPNNPLPPAASEPYGRAQIKSICCQRLPRPVDYYPTEGVQGGGGGGGGLFVLDRMWGRRFLWALQIPKYMLDRFRRNCVVCLDGARSDICPSLHTQPCP